MICEEHNINVFVKLMTMPRLKENIHVKGGTVVKRLCLCKTDSCFGRNIQKQYDNNKIQAAREPSL